MGRLDDALKLIEASANVVISARGNKVFVQGEDADVEKAKGLVGELLSMAEEGFIPRPEDLKRAMAEIHSSGGALKDVFSRSSRIATMKGAVTPKTRTQRVYIEAIKANDIVIGIGPAGTGKTYLAMATAVSALLNKQVRRLVFARPAVEAGEKLGFLPGDMLEKVNPYLRPLYDALFDMMEADRAQRYIESGIIEIAPLAFMRGRTLNDSFIILDEAQNTTAEQMKMYLTRLGFNSKTVITGDITQIDLPPERPSGLVEAIEVLKEIQGIEIIRFTGKDVVRHRLVQDIVEAYDKHKKRD